MIEGEQSEQDLNQGDDDGAFEEIVRPSHEKAAESFIEWVDNEVQSAGELQKVTISAYISTDETDFMLGRSGELEITEEGDEEINTIFAELNRELEETSARETKVSISVAGDTLELVNDGFQKLVKEATSRGAIVANVQYPQQNDIKRLSQERGSANLLGSLAEDIDPSTQKSFEAAASILFR